MFIFALLGMEFFAYKVHFNENNEVDLDSTLPYPDGNFNDFAQALLTIFVVLTGDAWSNVFYEHYRAVGVLASIYFNVLVIVGQYVIVMLFISILVDNYDKIQKEEQHKRKDDHPSTNLRNYLFKIKHRIKRLFVRENEGEATPRALDVA
mmetsp:Transcript_29253/g.28352  ORF Transcript_29253/g.28352 Transcript_29253/m.28352 type:complete len:150 (-) Transcript_29253:2749-3198(-)